MLNYVRHRTVRLWTLLWCVKYLLCTFRVVQICWSSDWKSLWRRFRADCNGRSRLHWKGEFSVPLFAHRVT